MTKPSLRSFREMMKAKKAAEAATPAPPAATAPVVEEKAVEKPADQPKKAKKKSRIPKLGGDGRLPHGSTFDVEYDANRGVWRGRLCIPGEKVYQNFNGEASGVFRLLRNLDQEYRDSLAGEK